MTRKQGTGRFLRDFAVIAATLATAVLIAAVTARAQTPGTDCGCSETGGYVAPDAGVKPPLASAATGLSPSGRYRIDVTSLPGQSPATLDVVRVSSGAVLLHNVAGVQWAFSPDGDRFVILSSVGSFPDQQFEYALYDLAAGVPAPRIWNNGPVPWSSARIRFSDDGSVFLFAGYHASVGTSLALLEVASRSLYEPTPFQPSSPPQDLDDDDDPAVAGWGFGPDPTRFVYAYVASSGTGLVQWGRMNVATRSVREEGFTANSMFAVFSPCGDAIAFVVKQLATSDLTDVTLYETQNPLAAPLGSEPLPFPALEVHATATEHQVLQGGETTFLASNGGNDTCPDTNEPPGADFDAPPGAVEGSPASFTDQSSDTDGTIVAWHWEFGDGATSSSQNPSHTYSASGNYVVRLTVTDDGGATDFVERTVSVCGSIASLSGRILYQDVAARELYILNADDGSTVRLTNGEQGYSEAVTARFSPDGTQIAYEERGNFLAGIWTMDADGSHRRRLTDGAGTTRDFDFHDTPVWSPDGEWIAFRNDDAQVLSRRGLWMVRADGSDLTQVPNTAYTDFPSGFAPGISCSGVPAAERTPGCYTLVFVQSAAGIAQIGGDGSGYTTVPSPPGSFSFLQLSKDGSAYVYSRYLGGSTHRVYTAERPFANEIEITAGGDDVFWYPTFSPDGDAVAYSFSVNGTPGSANNLDVGVTDASGCSSRTLLSGPFQQNVQDWATGHAMQSAGSIAGRVILGSGLTPVPFAVVELLGDYAATATADANGDFTFENVPIGANVEVRFVSAPGHIALPHVPVTFGTFSGHAVGFFVYAAPERATVTATVRKENFERLPDVTITADGEGEIVEATTDANGVASLEIETFGTYTLTPSITGFRFEPPSVSGILGGGFFEFTAIPLPPPGQIAFASSRSGDEDVWLANSDGTQTWNLTDRAGAQRDPAWSPDGRRIVYASDENGAGLELWIYDEETEEFTPLARPGREPAWSPDGMRLAYASDDGLRLLTLATDVVEPLTTDPSDASPTWRPDGGAVVFERSAGGETDLYEIPADLSGFAFPIESFAGDDRDPAFAAVGDGFAFSTQYAGAAWILARWGLDSWYVSQGGNPTWSQDGNQVAFDRDGGIYLRDPRGGESGTISESGSDRDPSWQPSGVPEPSALAAQLAAILVLRILVRARRA